LTDSIRPSSVSCLMKVLSVPHTDSHRYFSLAPTIEADSCPSLFSETEAPTSLDCKYWACRSVSPVLSPSETLPASVCKGAARAERSIGEWILVD
jgi:hypothetical protein